MKDTNKHIGNKKSKMAKVRKIMIFGVEVILLFVMLGVLWFVTRFTSKEDGLKKTEISSEDIVINEGLKNEEVINVSDNNEAVMEEEADEIETIAFFGLDSTTGELVKNTRSDTIMVAVLNKKEKEVHITSVYRDTYLNLGNDSYNKCNAAYAMGGAKQAISMLNMNLDLDIMDFISVGFKGVMDTVNAVGGIYIDIDSEELKHINNYQISIAGNLDITYDEVTEPGYQKVDGLQAMAYCRIRQVGNDFQRTERQREVLQAILDEAKKIDVVTLTKLAENVFGNFYTSMDLKDIVTLLSDIGGYTLIDEGGFPTKEYLTTATLGQNVGSSVICTNLEAAVEDFHERLYGDEDYTVTDTVKDISDIIAANTKPYLYQ